MQRNRLIAGVAAAAILVAVIGWVLGSRIKSPAELAAEAASPDPSLIVVPVEERELASQIVVRGTVSSSEETSVEVRASSGDASPIITRLDFAVGDELVEGAMALEIAGRPIIALEGALPVFRNLTLGLEGPDVMQLESALLRLGYDPGEVDGLFNQSTGTAITDLYQELGYDPDGPTVDELDALDAAEDQVRDAKRAVTAAVNEAKGEPITNSTRIQLDITVDEAEQQVREAKANRAEALTEPDRQLAEAETQLTEAESLLATSRDRLAVAESGTHPDTGTVPTATELSELRDAVDAAETTFNEVKEFYGAAEYQRHLVMVESDRPVRRAESELALALATRTETLAGNASPDAGATISAAREQLVDAEKDLARLQASTGVSFPAAELLFIPTLPRQVRSVSNVLGDTPEGAVMTITGSEVVVRSQITASEHALLTEGLTVTISDETLGINVKGSITLLADQPGGPNVEPSRYEMLVTPIGQGLENVFEQSLRIEIPITSTDGKVLAVPIAAVSADTDGTARIEKQLTDGSTRLIDVITGLSAGGYVKIQAVNDGDVAVGDAVVVGRDLNLPVGDEGG